jgi:FixJ family two-component response regulator
LRHINVPVSGVRQTGAMSQAAPQTVLVVDDDAAVRSALQFVLELEGFRVLLYDGAAALLADVLPSCGCLVIDYRMPGMDGLELVERLRARQVALPAIVISGRVDGDLRRRARRLGVAWVLEKPLSDAALVDSIRGSFANRPSLGRIP